MWDPQDQRVRVGVTVGAAALVAVVGLLIWAEDAPAPLPPAPPPSTEPSMAKVCVDIDLGVDVLWDVLNDDRGELGDDPIFLNTLNSGQGHVAYEIANRYNGPGGADPDDLVYGHLYRHRAPILCGPEDRMKAREQQIYRIAGTAPPPHRPWPEPQHIMRHGGQRYDG